MTEALKIKDLSVSYGSVAALSDVSLTVHEGEYLGIIGPNGGGKTTLISAVTGLLRPDSGTVTIFGEEGKKARGVIGYVPQNSKVSRDFPITVTETVMTAFLKGGAHPFKRFNENYRKKALSYLEMLGLSDLAKRNVSALSGGEFQRLLIARALATEPKLLVLDEPVSNVDPKSREVIYSLLESLNKSGQTILMVTHDLFAISSAVGSIACLNRTLVYHGEPKITDEISHAMYGCPVDLIAHGVSHRVLGGHSHD
jgi:zinc transport system ATP-binding protein